MELLTKAVFSDAVTEREKQNLDVAYRAACESVVMLKNDGALPFKGKKIAAFGPGVSHTIKGGTGSGEVNERRSISILQGLEERGFEVTTKKWLDDYETEYQTKLDEFKNGGLGFDILHPSSILNLISAQFQPPCGRAVSKQDIAESVTENCIYVVSRQAGEGGDRKLEKGDYYLTDAEIKDIKFCAEQYKHFVLVINCGSPVDMGFAAEIKGLRGILFISQLGSEGGLAVADILSGAVTPSGKLTDTWAKDYYDLPYAGEYSYLNGELEQEYYKEGIYVGYRYYETEGVEVSYPFGYGLSYTSFSYSKPVVKATKDGFEAFITVTNTGNVAGKESVQLYVSAPAGGLEKPACELKSFAKTRKLNPGESQVLSFAVDAYTLASFNENASQWETAAGKYKVSFGANVEDVRAVGEFTQPKQMTWKVNDVLKPTMELK